MVRNGVSWSGVCSFFLLFLVCLFGLWLFVGGYDCLLVVGVLLCVGLGLTGDR